MDFLDRSIIVDASAMRALLAGRMTQARRLATSPLANCRPGDRLQVKLPCIGVRAGAGPSQDLSSPIRDADCVVFADGWRQYRSGSGHAGLPPTNPDLVWTAAIHMPRWATRAILVILDAHIAHLHDLTREDCLAEGLQPLFAGALYRWPPPMRGVWRDPRRAWAARWDAGHGTGGERWADNPKVVVLRFRVETGPFTEDALRLSPDDGTGRRTA